MNNFVARCIHAALAVAAVVVVLLLAWFGIDTLLLGFAGLLVGIAFRSAAGLVSRVIGTPAGWSLAIALIVLACLLAVALAFVGPKIAAQADELRSDVPQAWEGLQVSLRRYAWGSALLDQLPPASQIFSQVFRGGRIFGAFSAALSITGSLIIVFFVALYFAADPGLYRRGILHLFPKDREPRAREVLDRVGEQLRTWLLVKLALMLFVGVMTAIGLWVLNVPLVITLAVLAALLDFIPNFGPVISAIPAVLLASTQGAAAMLWVAALYLTVQVVESYILQPLVQRRAVSLPPSLTLLAQVLSGTLFGVLGMILATPLTVAVMNLVQMLYVEDLLNRDATGK